MTRGLLLIDIQNDFLPGGALAVPRGDEVIAVANRCIASGAYAAVVATQDLHPPDHGSFASQHPGAAPYAQGELAGLPQTLWPDHCVRGSRGAELAEALDRRRLAAVVPKGTDPSIDSYSGFFDNARRKKTDLEATLRALGVSALDVVGLATDYCVKATVLDALELGFSVRVLVEGVRAVDLQPGDGARAIEAMREAGAELVGAA
ncbi:MAG: bifunctional nicotinamidase/pyrazinamidase [Sandaracinus sp.]